MSTSAPWFGHTVWLFSVFSFSTAPAGIEPGIEPGSRWGVFYTLQSRFLPLPRLRDARSRGNAPGTWHSQVCRTFSTEPHTLRRQRAQRPRPARSALTSSDPR
jgi:hypothetical protein